jgi:hypothetical protein
MKPRREGPSNKEASQIVFVRNKDAPKQPVKRIIRPTTFAGLIQNASKLFGITVKLVYNEDGIKITSIHEIEPDQVILVSAMTTEDGFQRTKSSLSICRAGEGDGGPVGCAGLLGDNESRSAEDQEGFDFSQLDLDEEDDVEAAMKMGFDSAAFLNLLHFLPFKWTHRMKNMRGLTLTPTSKFMSQSTNCEAIAGLVWWNFFQTIYGPIPEISPSVTRAADQFLKGATITANVGSTLHLRHAIVGPVKGGKSTFLKVLANSTLAQFLVTGQSKRTLIFYLDFTSIESTLNDPIKFYLAIVATTFKFLEAQHPLAAVIAPLLSIYFRKLVRVGCAPSLPNEFTTSPDFSSVVPLIADLAHRISDCLFELRALGAFLTNTVLFPRTIALAFGFQNVLFIADHLDAADVTLVPNEPFVYSEEAELLIEFLGLMLASDTFLVAARSEERLLHCLAASTAGAPDLRDGLTIASIVDVDADHEPRFEFAVTTADGAFRISMATCAGCPGYLVLWDRVVAEARRLQEVEKGSKMSEFAQELRADLAASLAELCRRIFPIWKEKIVNFDIFDTDEEIR